LSGRHADLLGCSEPNPGVEALASHTLI
jgi:hypothetical protein